MNTKIFKLFMSNLEQSFSLPKYDSVRSTLDQNTRIDYLPWTPVRLEKFRSEIEENLQLEVKLKGTVEKVVESCNNAYMSRFFGEIWRPNTDQYQYSGWNLVDEINKQTPESVLDIGCGYNGFKGRINNLIGIDPYNNCADYMVDILDFTVKSESFDHILALGSINYNDYREIHSQFSKAVDLLKPDGKLYLRVNPGQGTQRKQSPFIDIFPWTFEIAYQLADEFNLNLLTFKKEVNGRLFFIYLKK